MSDSYLIPSLVRSVKVLELLAQRKAALNLTEIADQTGFPKSTLYRILTTLQQQQCVVFNERDKTYRLGVKLWELGNAFLDQTDLYSAAVPHMKELANTCEESVFLGVLNEAHVIYVRRIESPKSVMAVRKLGQRAPAYCTATGRAMLALLPTEKRDRLLESQELKAYSANTVTGQRELRQRLDQVRMERVAVVDGEYNPELLCIASPVLNETGHPVASITVAMLSTQSHKERIQTVSKQVHQTAESLSRELGFLGDGVTSLAGTESTY